MERLFYWLGGLLISISTCNAALASNVNNLLKVSNIAKVHDDVQPFPGLNIDIDKCYQFCDGVRVDLKMNNTTNATNSFTLFGSNWSIPAQKSVFADAEGNTYKAQLKVGNTGKWTSIENDMHVPAGLMLRTSVMIEGVPQSLQQLALFDLRGAECGPHYKTYRASGRDINIEPYPQDGSEGILCTMPWVKVDLKSCKRVNNNVHVTMTITNVTNKEIPVDFTAVRQGVYDADGNVYDNVSLNVNNQPMSQTQYFLPNMPVNLVVIVKSVPVSLKQIELLGLAFPYEDFKWGIMLNKTDIITPTSKTVTKKAIGTTRNNTHR